MRTSKLSGFFLIFLLLLSACRSTAAAPVDVTIITTPTGKPTLTPPTQTPSPVPAEEIDLTECTNAATFVADVTVPDYAHFEPRATFTKTWRVRNSGTCTWTSDYSAVYLSGDRMGGPLTTVLGSTAPGSTLDISLDMAAPAVDGTFKIFYQLHNSNGLAMQIDDGDSLWTIITVGKTFVYPSPTSDIFTSETGPASTGDCVHEANAIFVNETLALINAARASSGLLPLTLDTRLNAAAQAHSSDMACSGNLSHTGSDGSQPAGRIAAAGYSASITRENIYAQPPQYGGNPQAALDWWLSSPIHRDAILNSQVTQIGIGYAFYSRSPLGGYFTVNFAAP